MTLFRMILATGLLATTTLPVAQAAEIVGGDVLEAGPDAFISGAQARDPFATGFSASLDGNLAVALLGAGTIALMIVRRTDNQALLVPLPATPPEEQLLPGIGDDPMPKADAS